MKAKGTSSLLGIASLAAALQRSAVNIRLVNQSHSMASPNTNQRQRRKNARRRWAAGDRRAFA